MRVCRPSFFLSSLQLVSSVNPDPTLLSLGFSTHCLPVYVSPAMVWITHLIYLTQHWHTHFSVSCSTFHFIFIFIPPPMYLYRHFHPSSYLLPTLAHWIWIHTYLPSYQHSNPVDQIPLFFGSKHFSPIAATRPRLSRAKQNKDNLILIAFTSSPPS